MKLLYKLLHRLVTFIFSLSVYVPYYFKLIKRQCIKLFWRNSEPRTVDDIRQDVGTLKNLPRHISFLVFEQDFELDILVRLIVWSVAAGISYVSVYDPQGLLKRKHAEFCEAVCQIRHELLDNQCELYFKKPTTNVPNGTVTENGYCSRKAYVSVLSSENGKDDIVNAVQKFCNSEECQSKVMNVDYFSHLLKGNHDFPDPDLALKFGQTDTLNGYLPWQIRLTEFISISTLRMMDYETLVNCLKKFSRCEQRLGR